jgi:nucleoside-diphosphate-sugar epimerase
MMDLPRLIVTGSSGFVGHHLVDAFEGRARIYGIARRSPQQCGVEAHPNLAWFQADIGDEVQTARAFQRIDARGGADVLIHLAAHYDLTGEEHDEYWRTNVQGLRHVLDQCAAHRLKHVVFASSVAACALPGPSTAITEATPPLGDHVYARTKRAGEEMLADYDRYFGSTILRIAALFSDWCEYPPLFMLLQTWHSQAWNRRVLAGRGHTAVPFLHILDLVAFMERVLERLDRFAPREVLQASPDGCVSHGQLFAASRVALDGAHVAPVHVPRALCRPGMAVRDLAGRLTGRRPFERPWMARYIDTEMRVDASATRRRLQWEPRPALSIVRRLPFLLENMKTDPDEWQRRNRAAMKLRDLGTINARGTTVAP